MATVYEHVKLFKKKHKGGITWWRLKKHSEVIQNHLNPKETVIYAFPGQKNDNPFDWFSTCVVAVTSKRILIGQKRLLWGYFLNSVTPDLYNDLEVYSGLIWGKIQIDTIKEVITLSNLSKSSLDEIETQISEYMMEKKAKLNKKELEDEKDN